MPIDIAVFADLEAAAADAAGALDRDAQPNLQDRIDWFRLNRDHCGLSGKALIVRARDDRGTAWLFLLTEGQHARQYGTWYTLDFGLVTAGMADPALAGAIASALRRHGIATISLAPVGDDRADMLHQAFADTGWVVRRAPDSINWVITLARPDWESYWNARPSRLRNTLRRKAKHVATTIHARFDAAAWQAYLDIYAESWKGAEGSPDFLRALAEQEGAAGTLRLGIATVNGEAAAAQLWLVENGRATIHKLAYRERFRAEGAGTVLSAAMFRHAIEVDSVTLIDFGRGDDPYKREWVDVPRPLDALRLWNPSTPAGLSALLVETARAKAGALLRRLRRRTKSRDM